MTPSLTEVFLLSFIAWFYVYGTWLFFSELLFCTFPLTIVGTVIVFLAVSLLRIPSPDASAVEEVLGQDFWTDALEDNENNEQKKYKMKIIAHRGACLDAPENSLTAIRKAKEKGCTAVEVDVALTKDDVPILYHDSDVDRLTDSSGLVSELTWGELQTLDIAAKHPCRDKYGRESITKFDEAVELCLHLNLRVFLDLKGDDTKLVPVILETFRKHETLYSRAVVSSFNPVLIYMIRRSDPRIVCSMAWRPHFFAFESYSGLTGEVRPRHKGLVMHLLSKLADLVNTWLFHNITYYILGLSAVLLQKDQLTLDIVRLWHQRSIRVIPWTVNLPSEKQFFSRVLKVPYMTDTLETNSL